MSVAGLMKMDGARGEAVWVHPGHVIGVERVGSGQPYTSRVYLEGGGMVIVDGLPSHVVEALGGDGMVGTIDRDALMEAARRSLLEFDRMGMMDTPVRDALASAMRHERREKRGQA